ncbi:lyase [Sphingomonas parva]|uniref:Virginiamycin B lyase n=1 Tax=Sphingomonas parva TaxID=2555898 RepID=A0A4Y8ZXQ5_9SPHN|nr:SMP-30/gluconolactonase/LRE family protein [Sphingomonas parva]TFI59276.1 lyase [Sphingomonas parva]
MRRSALLALALLATPACAEQTEGNSAVAPAAVEIRVFDLPKGSHPHDVAPASDGKIWYTAQHQGALGILDPATGAVRQVPLGPDSAPHGVIQGPDGAAWITDGGQNAIVRYEPKSGRIDVWKLPEETGYANLNTGAFDGDGMHWFTGQNGIYGRLDPKTGAIKVWKDPDGRGPYGIAATPAGEIYYVSLAGNHLARIDRRTGAAEIIEPPTPSQGARRVWSDSKGNLWISEWNSGQLSRFTPSSRAWKSWKLPGAKPQTYAVYVDERDIVWVTDFAANATLAFDPARETWKTYPGSAPDARVRQILGRPGEVFLPESGADRLMIVRTAQ